jgi:hypothetical protein
VSPDNPALDVRRKRIDTLTTRAARLRAEGLPFPIDRIRRAFEAAVAGGSRERAEAVVKLGETLLRRVGPEWTRVQDLLRRVDALRAITRTTGFSIPYFDTRLGDPRRGLISERLSSKSLDKAAEAASRSLAVLNKAVPTFCLQEARHLGKSIQHNRNLGEDVADATRSFSQLLRALRERDFGKAAHRMVDVRREVAASPFPKTSSDKDGASPESPLPQPLSGGEGASPGLKWARRAWVGQVSS